MATNPYNQTPGPPGQRRNPPDESSFLSSTTDFLGNSFDRGADIAKDFGSEIASSVGLAKTNRSKNIDKGGDAASEPARAQWRNTINNPDWRVKLSMPRQFKADKLLKPLAENNALVFPYTPTIILGHSANYNSLQPVHTNYPYQIYESSNMQEIVITGDFTAENAEDGRYWIAAIHYLRSVTKMFYGSGENSGQPPPRVKLNGYGDYVFNDVPCVVTNFTVDLPSDVDYIAVPMDITAPPNGAGVAGGEGQAVSWVPSTSLITVTVQPVYSRTTVSRFNLNDFVKGKYISTGGGFI